MIYKDWEELFEALDSTEEIGELIMALFAYAKRGEEPTLRGGAKIAFLSMRSAIERDGKSWEETVEKNVVNGRKGGRPRKNQVDKTPEVDTSIADTKTEGFSDKPTESYIETDKETETNIEKDTVIDKDKKTDKRTTYRNYGVHDNVTLTSAQYDDIVSLSKSVGLSAEKYINKLSNWQYTEHKICAEPFETISKWINEDAADNYENKRVTNSNNERKTSYDLDDYEEFAMHYDLSKIL